MTRIIACVSGKGGVGKTTVVKDLKGTDPRNLPNILLDLLGDSEIILLDVAAGLGRETLSALEAADEILLVTNPEVPAVTDALKAVKLAQQMGTKISGVVINRVTGRKHEMKTEDVMSMLGEYEPLGIIPEDINVQKSIASRVPVVHYSPRSPASKELNKLAARMTGTKYYQRERWYNKWFGFLR
ncbi:MAG: P-loop NTPase [Candidatus Aenigmarchaeota archaeon]|nr:P-loop NTPase [Candidatus Aenigmarchaeota archaeon]